MSNYVSIETDRSKFQERVDELTSSTSYDTVRNVVSRIKKALYANSELAALSAPQIGEDLRLFVVRLSRDENQRFKVFINPLIVSHEGLHLSRETNPCFPETQFIIPRSDKIHVAYQDTDGRVESETYIGAYSEIIQQMIDLLDGILLSDYGLDLADVGGYDVFDKSSDKQKTEVLSMYLSSIKDLSSKFSEEIENDDKLKNLNDTIKFMTGMIKGDITPINPDKPVK